MPCFTKVLVYSSQTSPENKRVQNCWQSAFFTTSSMTDRCRLLSVGVTGESWFRHEIASDEEMLSDVITSDISKSVARFAKSIQFAFQILIEFNLDWKAKKCKLPSRCMQLSNIVIFESSWAELLCYFGASSFFAAFFCLNVFTGEDQTMKCSTSCTLLLLVLCMPFRTLHCTNTCRASPATCRYIPLCPAATTASTARYPHLKVHFTVSGCWPTNTAPKSEKERERKRKSGERSGLLLFLS